MKSAGYHQSNQIQLINSALNNKCSIIPLCNKILLHYCKCKWLWQLQEWTVGENITVQCTRHIVIRKATKFIGNMIHHNNIVIYYVCKYHCNWINLGPSVAYTCNYKTFNRNIQCSNLCQATLTKLKKKQSKFTVIRLMLTARLERS